MVRLCEHRNFETICSVINDAALAYKGVIPEDRWHEPYMSRAELEREIKNGVVFWGYEGAGELVGVMGIQRVRDVDLIRHAYVRTDRQKRGVGTELLKHLLRLATRPVLVGTWADASWAVCFYEKHGFRLVSEEEKERLLRNYWSIPERQIETSVVLAHERWLSNGRLLTGTESAT